MSRIDTQVTKQESRQMCLVARVIDEDVPALKHSPDIMKDYLTSTMEVTRRKCEVFFSVVFSKFPKIPEMHQSGHDLKLS
jgi:hypothetical protein